jgi:hypothetical protein
MMDGVEQGRWIVRASWAGTVVLLGTTVPALAWHGPIRTVHVAVAMALFAIGCFCFLWAYAVAVQRSRDDEIGIGGLFFLAGDTAPKQVRLRLDGALAAQTLVAVAGASIRPFTTLAFGVLAPMFGLGLNGLWGASYGRFGPRIVDPPPRPQRGGAPTEREPDDQMEQNAEHG